MKKRMIIMIIALGVVFGGLLAWNVIRGLLIKSFISKFEPPPISISTSIAQNKIWQPYLSAIGSLTAANGVDITAETAGIVEDILFESGQQVIKGQLLVRLNDDVDQANLKDAQSDFQLAQLTFKRQQGLYKRGATPSSELDAARSRLQKASAAVDKIQALVDQKQINAPFAGRLGIGQIDLGEYVNPGQSVIVTLQAMNPMYVKFFLPEQFIRQIYVGQPLEVRVDGYPNRIFTGAISAIDAKADVATHNIQLQGRIPNEDGALYPGLFAHLKVLLPQEQNVIVVPETAIAYSLYGDSVFVVTVDEQASTEEEPVLRVHRQFVVVGERENGEATILRGLSANEQVVDAGQLKLDNGARVVIDNTIKLEQQTIRGEGSEI
ncbi:MAG: efflux RND transporter periplasmic adaptor subunit [Legionellales bacterium]|nr:efflux RND transporter periplasmic adaptor subunit [Legionellales bacterium]